MMNSHLYDDGFFSLGPVCVTCLVTVSSVILNRFFWCMGTSELLIVEEPDVEEVIMKSLTVCCSEIIKWFVMTHYCIFQSLQMMYHEEWNIKLAVYCYVVVLCFQYIEMCYRPELVPVEKETEVVFRLVIVISSFCLIVCHIYFRESEGICFYRRWFVSVCVCLSVTTITKKIVDGFVPNFVGRFLGGKGRPSLCFVMIGRGMWK